MKNKILQEFLDSNIKIKSLEKLEYYIDFCIENNHENRIKGKSSHHHILPQADSLPFKEFSNLKKTPWNGTHLMYSDHYKAHYYLSEAIDDYGQLYVFTKMHNVDIANGRIEEKDLIPDKEFQEKMEERSKKQNDWDLLEDELGASNKKKRGLKGSNTMNKEFLLDGVNTSIAKERGKLLSSRMDIIKGNYLWSYIRKERMTKKFILDGVHTSKSVLLAEKSAEKCREKFILDGVETTINEIKGEKMRIRQNKTVIIDGKTLKQSEVNALKANITKKVEYINEKGVTTSILKESNIKRIKLMAKKSRKFNINHIKFGIVMDNILLKDTKKISSSILNNSKINYLGRNDKSINNLKRYKKEWLEGVYIEEIKKPTEKYNEFSVEQLKRILNDFRRI